MVRQLIPVRRAASSSASPTADNIAGEASASAKRVALLCGGLSLRLFWSEERAQEFDEVVAINGAAFAFACDWAVMVDRPLVQRMIEGDRWPRKGLVTYATAYQQRFARKGQLKAIGMVAIPNVGPKHKSYTMPRAVLWALQRAGAAGTVEIFGMDYSDAGKDVAGLKGDHGPIRWQKEADVLRVVWDGRIRAVHGSIVPERLAYIRRERHDWPG